MKHWNGLPVVDDDYPTTHSDNVAAFGYGTGYDGRDYAAFPLNGQSYNAAPTVARLSEKEIVERVIEKIAKRSFYIDLLEMLGVLPKNQQQSSYCWIHAPTGAMDGDRAIAGHTNPILYHSAFFAGSQIKHGANQGGSGVQGVKWLVEHGTCREDLWLPMKFKGEATAEIKADAAKRQVVICEEFEPGDHIGINSSLVQNQPISVGVPSWSHEVLLGALVFKDGKPKGDYGDIRRKFRNSWGNWGDKGCGVLDGSKAKLDEAMRVVSIEEAA